MNVRDFLISALDLVLFIVGFLAVKYDGSKGVSESAFATAELVPLAISSHNDRHFSGRFHALVLTQLDVILYRCENGKTSFLGKYSNVQRLIQDGSLNKSTPCVLYEKEQTPLLAEAIRALAANGIPIGIAELQEEIGR